MGGGERQARGEQARRAKDARLCEGVFSLSIAIAMAWVLCSTSSDSQKRIPKSIHMPLAALNRYTAGMQRWIARKSRNIRWEGWPGAFPMWAGCRHPMGGIIRNRGGNRYQQKHYPAASPRRYHQKPARSRGPPVARGIAHPLGIGCRYRDIAVGWASHVSLIWSHKTCVVIFYFYFILLLDKKPRDCTRGIALCTVTATRKSKKL